jgi:hypothetical protein
MDQGHMGVVTNYLFQLIARQVEEHRLMVWYDPEEAYAAAAAAFDLPNTTVARYDGSFFRLRHAIDSLLNDAQPPRLVVYVPEDRGKTDHALIELEAAGVVIQPGQQPPPRNTRLAIVARNALKSILGDETAAEIEKQVDAGKLSLADLNALADKGKDISTGVLSLIFGTSHPQEVALAFLNSDTFDHDVDQKSARPQLIGLLRNAFEIDLPESIPLAEVRQRLAGHVLLTDFLAGLGEAAPPSLVAIKIASASPTREACISLVYAWRLRRDVRDSYVITAKQVEQTLDPSSFVISPSLLETKDNGQRTIDRLETFLAIERALMQYVECALLQSTDETLLGLAESRLSRFWSDVTPAIQAHWATPIFRAVSNTRRSMTFNSGDRHSPALPIAME